MSDPLQFIYSTLEILGQMENNIVSSEQERVRQHRNSVCKIVWNMGVQA